MTTPATPPSISSSIHIYRGIMDRATAWRQRIDSPTNWAITTGGAVSSFVLNDALHSHAVLLLVMLLTFAFLLIEARRMRYYDLWASWARVLETDYLAGILRDNQIGVRQSWERLLVRDFEDPHFKVTTRQLIAQRLRDNYLVLYLFLLLCWLLKLLIHQPVDQGFESNSLIGRAAIGPIPGGFVFFTVLACYATLIIFTLFNARQQPSVEVLSREQTLQRMTSPRQQQMSRRMSHAALLERYVNEEDDELLKTKDWD